MLLGPIFSVELVTGARRTRYFVLRVLYGVILLMALSMVYLSYFEHTDPSDIGAVAGFASAFFATFTVIQLVAVVLLAPAMAAGTIASERERRTIEYLFVSHLSNVEIVLGKLAARLVQIACLVLVGLPVLSIAGLLGGIAPEALVVAFLITLSTAVCVAILSISVSVWSARARDAVIRAYLVMLCLLLVPVVVEATLSSSGWWFYEPLLGPVNGQFLAANPFWILERVVWAASAGDVVGVQTLLGALVRNQFIVSALALAAATLAVRRVHLRARSVGAKRRLRLMQWVRPRPGDSPMLWKEVFAEPGMSRLGWIGRVAVVLISLVVLGPTVYQFLEAIDYAGGPYSYGGHRSEMFLGFTAFMGTVVACGGLLLIAARSATAVTAEKERDCWTSLLSTPMAPRDIVVAKVLGSIYAVRGVLFLLGFVWVLAVVVEPGFLISVAFTLGTLLLVAFCVSSLGVLLSLWCRNSLRSMAATLAIGVFVGGGYLFCCMLALFAAQPHSDEGTEIILAPCIPFLLAFPSIMYVEGDNIMRHSGAMVTAYVLGVIFYMVAGLLLVSAAIGNFDQLCERTGTTAPTRPPGNPPPPPQIVIPEVVDEG